MRCKKCEAKLLEYLYGELSAGEAAEMERHLADSEPCREVCRNFRETLNLVSVQEESDSFPEALHTRILAHAEEGARQSAVPSRRWAWLFRPALATAMVAVIAAGVYLYSIRSKEAFDRERLTVHQEAAREALQEYAPRPEKKETGRKEKSPESPAASAPALDREVAAPPEEQESRPPQVGLSARGPQREPQAEEAEPPAKGAEPVPSPKGFAADATGGAGSMEADSGYRPPPEAAAPAPPPALERRSALKSEAEPALSPADARLPGPLQEAVEAAGQGRCADAARLVEAYARARPGDEASGRAWLEIARCYSGKGDKIRARETADKALAFRGSAEEAVAFLQSLEP
ncbi:MAG: zf-HC2 domain-containing protein [bacterium]